MFVDPQFLLQKISELVKYHYKLRGAPDPHAATQGGLKKFVTEGCITLKLLEQFSEQYTDLFTPADFLKLMNDRLIAAHLISNDEYFMPCLLRTMESQEIDQYRVTASGVAPLNCHSLLMQVGTTWCFLFLGGIPSFITEFFVSLPK